jgi:glycosyltransferase involved in cell wall biosynthesis
MIDPKGLISDPSSATFMRHLEYSLTLGKENSHARLTILTSSSQSSQIIFESEFLILINYFRPRNYLFRKSRFNFKALQSLGISPILFIAGEPFETYFYTQIIRKRFRSKTPIQLQLHFDPEQFRSGSGILGKVRFYLSLMAIIRCSSIRLVNRLQLRSIPKFVYGSKQITISPLPISKNALSGKVFNKGRPRNIGIFGRLHSERGTEELINAISILPRESFANVVIAGSGELKADFISRLSQLIGAEHVIYLGHLDPDSQHEFWDKVGVLISFPQFEAYGVSMRESLCQGVPVLTTRTIGSELLESECSKNWIRILKNIRDPEELANNLELAFSTETDDSLKERYLTSNIENKVRLIRSWLPVPEH